MSTLRAVAVVVVLPIFLAFYRRFFASSSSPASSTATSEEREPLLGSLNGSAGAPGHVDTESGPRREDTKQISTAAVAQELVIVRICFVIDALGMFLLSISRSSCDIILCELTFFHCGLLLLLLSLTTETFCIATAIGSLGSPAGPSLQALVTLAASPDELGRILAGFSVLESAAVAVRSPTLFALYSVTLEVLPQAVWLVATVSAKLAI